MRQLAADQLKYISGAWGYTPPPSLTSIGGHINHFFEVCTDINLTGNLPKNNKQLAVIFAVPFAIGIGIGAYLQLRNAG